MSQSLPSSARPYSSPAFTRMKGTGLVVWAVQGSPVSQSIICSAFPWSAQINIAPPTSLTASTALPTQVSTASIAFTAASMTPVCPTISGFAKLQIIASYFPLFIAFTSPSHTSNMLISGCKSQVATLGDFTRILSSPGNGSSKPPLKKKVTCAYFSVSAVRSCVLPSFERYSPKVFLTSILLKATVLLGIFESQSVKQTNLVLILPPLLSNPSKSSLQKAFDISLALSGRKLKKMMLSSFLIVATGAPSLSITVGTTNSSVTSPPYELSMAATGSVAVLPSPYTIALYASSTLSQRLSLSIAQQRPITVATLPTPSSFIFATASATKSRPLLGGVSLPSRKQWR